MLERLFKILTVKNPLGKISGQEKVRCSVRRDMIAMGKEF